MKKLAIISAIAISGLACNTANAQIRFRFGLHFAPRPVVYIPARAVIQEQPVYGQQPVYDEQDQAYDYAGNDYYYLPDVDAYYNINEQCYEYFDGSEWVSAAYLPGEYRYYDWRNAPRYEVRAPRPYLHNDFYRSRYNGRQVRDWGHFDHRDRFNGGYAGNDRGDYGHRFGNGAEGGFDRGFNSAPHDNRFDNRSQGGTFPQNQPMRNPEEYNRAQPESNNGGYGERPYRGQQTNRAQSAQPGQGFGQRPDNRGPGANVHPSNQDQSQGRDARGGTEHYVQNSPQGGFANHRLIKF